MAKEKYWTRRHGNGWRGIVKQVEDGTYWSAAKKTQPWMSGYASQVGIPRLELAMAIADEDVEQKAPHSCEDLKCDPWPDHPSELMD